MALLELSSTHPAAPDEPVPTIPAPAGGDRKDRLIRVIEEEILGGHYMPGERLDERLLAERFGLSRTPIREALNRLATTGLVEIRPNAGIFVATPTVAEVCELYEAVGELEVITARLATRRATPEQRRSLSELAAAFGAIAEAGDIDLFATRNIEFHALIYEAAHNRYLAQQTAQARRRIWAFRRMHFRAPGRLSMSAAEHVAVAGAIARGDEAAATRIMQTHGDIYRETFADFVMILSRELPGGR